MTDSEDLVAEIEALEEAGARGHVSKDKIGTYRYDKKLDDGSTVQCRVSVYPMIVEKLKRNWKERAERKRHWFSPKSAASEVKEPELARLLLRLDGKLRREPVLRALLKAA